MLLNPMIAAAAMSGRISAIAGMRESVAAIRLVGVAASAPRTV